MDILYFLNYKNIYIYILSGAEVHANVRPWPKLFFQKCFIYIITLMSMSMNKYMTMYLYIK